MPGLLKGIYWSKDKELNEIKLTCTNYMKRLHIHKQLLHLFTNVQAYCLVCLMLALFSSCKKESPDFPYAEMINFSIVDANGAPLKGVIENNEIIIYWPPEQPIPETVTPTITISERANVQPASNTAIAFADGTSFTVTAQDGTAKVYQLKRVVNVPKPYINTFSGVTTYNDKNFVLVGEQLNFMGDYFNTSEGQLKVFLLNATGQEVEIPIDSNATPLAVAAILGETAVGTYTSIRLESAPYAITVERDFEVIEDPRPSYTPLSTSLILNRGQQSTLLGKNMDKIKELQLNNENSNDYIPVEILRVSLNEVDIKIPADFPIDSYQAMGYTYEPNAYFSDIFSTVYLPNAITIIE